jgi:hypothetical protein
MTRDDVIDVLTAVAAATRRTVGTADVEVWQAVIGDLPLMGMVKGKRENLALLAVRDHLKECPGVWLEPGHVFQRVRAFVRDELEKEPDTARDARQAALEAKVSEDVAALAESKGIPYERPSKALGTNPLSVRCPWCHAQVGQHCTIPRTRERPDTGTHPSRREAAAAQGVAS